MRQLVFGGTPKDVLLYYFAKCEIPKQEGMQALCALGMTFAQGICKTDRLQFCKRKLTFGPVLLLRNCTLNLQVVFI